MLKNMQRYKVVRTKTEVTAMNDFLNQVEKLKEADAKSNGVILVFHEHRKVIPYMMIEVMKKYKIMPRFRRSTTPTRSLLTNWVTQWRFSRCARLPMSS